MAEWESKPISNENQKTWKIKQIKIKEKIDGETQIHSQNQA